MTMTNRFDAENPSHTELCGRTTCAAPDVPVHQAGRHLDQRSEHYDGPRSQLAATSMYVRDSARKIILDAPESMPEVMDLVTYIGFLSDQVAHVQVDRDNKVREAMMRSESCEHHGGEIKALGEQVHHFDQSHHRADAGRVAVLGLLHAVDELVQQHETNRLREGLTVDQLVEALKRSAASARRAHDRAWKR